MLSGLTADLNDRSLSIWEKMGAGQVVEAMTIAGPMSTNYIDDTLSMMSAAAELGPLYLQAGRVLRAGGVGLAPNNATSLTYDISRWGEYGLPSDGYFVRTLNERQAFKLSQGEPIEFGGQATKGYESGMGFIGAAEEVRTISTGAEYASKLNIPYEPKYLLEFQIKDPTGLRNVLDAPYAEFVRGGKTASGSLEWNYPGINSGDITNWRLRELK